MKGLMYIYIYIYGWVEGWMVYIHVLVDTSAQIKVTKAREMPD